MADEDLSNIALLSDTGLTKLQAGDRVAFGLHQDGGEMGQLWRISFLRPQDNDTMGVLTLRLAQYAFLNSLRPATMSGKDMERIEATCLLALQMIQLATGMQVRRITPPTFDGEIEYELVAPEGGSDPLPWWRKLLNSIFS